MGRYAKSNQTIEDLKRMIEDNGGIKETIGFYKMLILP
jgi:hypothetical protein